MSRPPSILLFERLYLGSTALYLINAVLFWAGAREAMLMTPQVSANPAIARLIPGIMVGSLALSVGLSLLFWFLVARRGSMAGKWLVVVTEGLGACAALLAIVRLLRGAPFGISIALGFIATAMAIAAAALLFRPDAQRWLGAGEARLDKLP